MFRLIEPRKQMSRLLLPRNWPDFAQKLRTLSFVHHFTTLRFKPLESFRNKKSFRFFHRQDFEYFPLPLVLYCAPIHSIVFCASLSSASTHILRCSSFVSSSFACESPRKL